MIKKEHNKHSLGVIGVDEVGRGPLAGPVTVCAVYIEDVKKAKKDFFDNTIRDSKKLSKVLRNNIYQTIRHKRYSNIRLEYSISSRSGEYIDKHGINKATQACILSCLRSLSRQDLDISQIQINLDAGLNIPLTKVRQESFIRGDERFTEIALASIIAKVTRDTYMKRLAKQHNEYSWESNVGYGTKYHREAIGTIGITKYHRRTYLKAFELFDKAE